MPKHELQPDDQNDEQQLADESVAHDEGLDVEDGAPDEEKEEKEEEEQEELAMS